MQLPDWHWLPEVQFSPLLSLGTQLPPLQVLELELQFAAQVPPQPSDTLVVRHEGQLCVQQLPPEHTWLLPVQLAAQVPPQPSDVEVVRHDAQLGVQHVPPLQTWLPAQSLPHDPQLDVVESDAQLPPQQP